MKTDSILNSIEKRRFISDAQKAETVSDVLKLARSLVIEKAKKNGISVEDANQYLKQLTAIGKCTFYAEKAKNPVAYIQNYILFKYQRFLMGDTGAMGDAVENVCHLVACRELWRTNKSHLHVSEIDKLDITINNIPFEVGHNAKTWNCLKQDVENQNHKGVIYGVFDADTVLQIVELAKVNPKKAITAVCNRLYVFENKAEYFDFMGKAINQRILPDGRIVSVTQYNKYRHGIFLREVKAREIPTLTQYMKALGKNDYLL